MASLLLLERALGSIIGELLRRLIAAGKETKEFGSQRKTLKNTLQSVVILFGKIEERRRVLDRPPDETSEFIDQLRHGVYLLDKCSKAKFWNRHSYSNKLVKLDKSIVKFFNIQVQCLVAMNTLSNEVGIQEINHKLDFMFKYLNIDYIHRPLYLDDCAAASTWFSCERFPVVPGGAFGVGHQPQELKEMKRERPNIIPILGRTMSAVLKVTAMYKVFKTGLNTLRETLDMIKIVLGGSQEQTSQLLQINHRVNIVHEYSTVTLCNQFQSGRYLNELSQLKKSVSEFLSTEVQGVAAMKTLSNGVGTKKGYDKFSLARIILQTQYGSSGFNCSCSSGFGNCTRIQDLHYLAPLFDEELEDFKGILLHDKKPTTDISCAEQCGKTNLDKKLRWDPDTQIFGRVAFSDRQFYQYDQQSTLLSFQSAIPDNESPKIAGGLVEQEILLNVTSIMSFRFSGGESCCEAEVLWSCKKKNSSDDKSINAKKASKTIQRNKPELKVRCIRDSQIRKNLPGVVITETPSQVFPSQASRRNSNSLKGGKGKEKVIYEPEKKALKPKGGNYY